MKRKIRVICIVLLSAAAYLCISTPTAASGRELHSKGNMIFKDGTEFAFYEEDVFYLQREIDALFNEIN